MHLFLPNRSAIHPEESPPIAVPAVYVDAIVPESVRTLPILSERVHNTCQNRIAKLAVKHIDFKARMGDGCTKDA